MQRVRREAPGDKSRRYETARLHRLGPTHHTLCSLLPNQSADHFIDPVKFGSRISHYPWEDTQGAWLVRAEYPIHWGIPVPCTSN